MMRTNFHTHTSRCNHAFGTDDEFVTEAVKSKYKVLGISDHCPWPDEIDQGSRMYVSGIPEYVAAVHSLRDKYADKMTIHIGFECEFLREHMAWLDEMMDKHGIEYALLGHHFERDIMTGYGANRDARFARRYVEHVVEAMRSGRFAYVAHPDFFLRSMPSFTDELRALSRELCDAARELDVPLEYNLYGLRKQAINPFDGLNYPTDHFWRVAAEAGVTTVIGVDAHLPRHLSDPALGELAEKYLGTMGVNVKWPVGVANRKLCFGDVGER